MLKRKGWRVKSSGYDSRFYVHGDGSTLEVEVKKERKTDKRYWHIEHNGKHIDKGSRDSAREVIGDIMERLKKERIARELVKLAREIGSAKRPQKGEEVYAEYDEDSGEYCVFGTESGFAYESYSSMRQAERAAERMNKRNRI